MQIAPCGERNPSNLVGTIGFLRYESKGWMVDSIQGPDPAFTPKYAKSWHAARSHSKWMQRRVAALLPQHLLPRKPAAKFDLLRVKIGFAARHARARCRARAAGAFTYFAARQMLLELKYFNFSAANAWWQPISVQQRCHWVTNSQSVLLPWSDLEFTTVTFI